MVTPHQQTEAASQDTATWNDWMGRFGRKQRQEEGREKHTIKILSGLPFGSGFLTSCRMLETETLVWPTGRDAVAQTDTAHRSFLS